MIVRDGVHKGETSPLTQERLMSVLHYEPSTGAFTRLRPDGSHQRPAGTHDASNGYVKILVDGVIYRAHRLAFLYMEGSFPPNDVDHKNCNKADNRWRNLRHATPSQNGANKPAKKNCLVPFKAVVPCGNRYKAHITVMGEHLTLGIYNTPEEANAAYMGAARVLWGEFARAN